MKVALINSGKKFDETSSGGEPLNVGFIAAYLEKHGADVVIIDQLAGQDVKNELEKFKPDIAGITGTTAVIDYAYRAAEICKEMGIFTVMGGIHASILPNEVIKHADAVVVGEGEKAMLSLAKNPKRGIIKGEYIEDLNEVPFPARHLMQMDFYLKTKERMPNTTFMHFVPKGARVSTILTSRGCPYNCIFCWNSWRNIPYRFNSPKRVIEEIKHLIENYDVSAIWFHDDNLLVNRPRIMKISELMKKNNISIPWGCNSRVNNVDYDLLKTIKEAGCRQVDFGFESGSQRILNILNKGTTVEQNLNAINLCRKVGLDFQGSFVIGTPTETLEDIKMTEDFINENDIYNFQFCVLTAYPGTELWKYCEKNNMIPDNLEWTMFNENMVPFSCNKNFSAEELGKIFSSVHKKLILKKIMRHPIKSFKKLLEHPKSSINFYKRMKE
jgi:radical SAM superfamily enzyme YgiQ (UPF0313 family)